MMKDLTTGSPMRLILGFGLPTLLGMLFQQFYNLMDTMIVGKLLGAGALAAVGSTSSISFLVIGFCMGVCNGFAIPVAQRVGANDPVRMRRYVANAAYLSALFALVLTVATGLLCRAILTVMQTPADIFDGAYIYIFIIFMGIPTTFLYNLLAGIIRSLGDSRAPVYFLALSSVLNIFLDFCLHPVVPHGGGGGGHRHGGVPGDLRRGLPGLYGKEVPHPPDDPGGAASGSGYLPPPVHHGGTHGATVLHHRHRLHRAPGRGQWPGQHLCGGGGGGKQAVSAALLPL